MAIVPDSAYTITFKAKSSIERTIIAGVGLNSGDYANSAESVSLTTEWQTFTLSQTSTGFGDDSSRVLFDMGGDQGGQVWLDDISVTTADGTELVSNGDFQAAATADQVFGLAGWSSGAAVAGNITSYFAVAETTSGNVYDVNLSQIMAIVPDTTYTITFKAKSSIERTIIAGVGLNSGDYANSAESVSLTTAWQTFTLSQTSTGFGDDSSRVLFDMGGDQGGQVWIDDVSVMPPAADPVTDTSDLGTGTDTTLNVGEVINFNSTVANYGLVDFGGNISAIVQDPTDATNTVVSVTKGSENWAGTTIASGNVIYPLTATETVMTVRVWSPEAGITVRLKLEESGDATHTVETDAVTTVASAWEVLTFDFSNPATNDGNPTNPLNVEYVFDTLSIFLNYGVAGSAQTYYFDDVTFVGAGTTAPVTGSELVTNGGFQDGITGWSSGAAVAGNITSYFAVAETTSGNVYDVNLSQVMAIVPDSAYTITFKAKSSIERTIIAGVGLNSGDYANSAESVSLTTEWQTFTLSQTSTGFGDDSSRVLFDMGGDQGGQVWLDDISVTTADGTELVSNGDFQAAATADQVFGLAGWSSGAAVAGNITSYFAVAETTSGNVYDVNLSQIMAIVPDTTYTITFKAKSSIERTIIAGVGLNSGDYANSAESVSLTTAWQTFTLSQTSTGFGDDSSRVLFDMGGDQGGQVWIDDVSVK